MSYPFTMYSRPHGHPSEHEMANILPADEAYLEKHDVKISMEELSTGQIVIYADDGTLLDDNETPNEITYIVKSGESCEDAMAALCQLLRKRKEPA